MSVKAEKPKPPKDPSFLGVFRVIVTDSVLAVISSYRRYDVSYRQMPFADCVKRLQGERRVWRVWHFFPAEKVKVDIPVDMIPEEFDRFLLTQEERLRAARCKDDYGYEVVKLYRRPLQPEEEGK